MDIRRATASDTELLIKVRLDFLRDQRPVSPESEAKLIPLLRDYFPAHIEAGNFVAVLGFEGDEVATAAYMSYLDYPPNDKILGTRRASAANVYTYPAHRRKGHATALVRALTEIARGEGAAMLELYATEAGRKVYEQIGFVPVEDTPMRLDLLAGSKDG